jgi:hypothetical protein
MKIVQLFLTTPLLMKTRLAVSNLPADNTVVTSIESFMEKETGGFDSRNLRAALDCSPLWGAAKVEDTYNLLGHTLRKALGVIARQLCVSPDPLIIWVETVGTLTGQNRELHKKRKFLLREFLAPETLLWPYIRLPKCPQVPSCSRGLMLRSRKLLSHLAC